MSSNELRKQGDLYQVVACVCSVWLGHNLENFRKRLKTLDDNVVHDGTILSDVQAAALEKKRHDDDCGELETVSNRFGALPSVGLQSLMARQLILSCI